MADLLAKRGKCIRWPLISLVAAASICLAADAGKPRFLGPESCELCHKEIGAKQERTAMANTWQGRLPAWLPPSFDATAQDDPSFEVKRTPGSIAYLAAFGDSLHINLPVSISMGGRRHGLGFLISLRDVDGIPTARPTLVQARYAWSPEKQKLLLAPGCPTAKPQSYEAALGLVLSPTFASRCVSCHGQPNIAGSGKGGGVHCEACHGPGSNHLVGIAQGDPTRGIVNPRRLTTDESMAICAQCHVGLTNFSDPSPADLLVANQVRAIKSSECFLQSAKAFSCTTCHDPHNDATDASRAINACLSCHATGATKHASICPVNSTSGCIGCHMPSVDMGPLHLVDHLIRVHPEQGARHPAKINASLKSTVQPISEYLRIITSKTPEAASAMRDLISSGKSFYTVAREGSEDRSSIIGGYLGSKTLAELPKALQDSAIKLGYGETSPVLHNGDEWVVIQRLPRDFRSQAEALQDQAEALAAGGNPNAAITRSQEALMIYPQLLRALNFIGITFAQNGNPEKGAKVLTTATHLYPTDAGAEFALAASLSLQGNQSAAIEAYRRVITLETDFTAAYVNLGMISYSSKNWQSAITTFRQGLQIDPLSAELNYDLALALEQSGDRAAGAQALNLAKKLDSGLVERRENER